MQEYSLAGGLQLGGAARMNWEEGIGEADNPPSPVRVIEITDEIRAQDAAKQAQRADPILAWRERVQLDPANLRKVKPAPKPKAAAKPAVKSPRRKPCPSPSVPPAPMECATTAAVLDAIATASSPEMETMQTIPPRPSESEKKTIAFETMAIASDAHQPVAPGSPDTIEVLAAEIPVVESPGVATREASHAEAAIQPSAVAESEAPLAGMATYDAAPREQYPSAALEAPAAAPQYCMAGCGAALRVGQNTTGFCWRCNELLKRKNAEMSKRPVCVHPSGCTRRLRSGKVQRTDGLCGYHGELADKAARGGAFAKRVARKGSKCGDCGEPISPIAKSGKCRPCSRTVFLTELRATSREEHELNQMWADLCVEDRWALLEAVAG